MNQWDQSNQFAAHGQQSPQPGLPRTVRRPARTGEESERSGLVRTACTRNEVYGYQETGANRRGIDRAGLLTEHAWLTFDRVGLDRAGLQTEHAPLTEGLHYSSSN